MNIIIIIVVVHCLLLLVNKTIKFIINTPLIQEMIKWNESGHHYYEVK